MDIVVSPSYDEFSEILGVLEGVEEIRNKQEWIAILDCDVVEFAIILHGSEGSIFFLDEEEGRGHWRF